MKASKMTVMPKVKRVAVLIMNGDVKTPSRRRIYTFLRRYSVGVRPHRAHREICSDWRLATEGNARSQPKPGA